MFIIDGFTNESLDEYVLTASDDPVKTDLELIHTPCGERLCDAEHEDSLGVLARVASDHICGGNAGNGA